MSFFLNRIIVIQIKVYLIRVIQFNYENEIIRKRMLAVSFFVI